MSLLNITQPLGIWSIMATIVGDVQYSQVMGHLPTPVVPLLCWTSSDFPGFAMRGSTPRVRLRTEVGWLVGERSAERWIRRLPESLI